MRPLAAGKAIPPKTVRFPRDRPSGAAETQSLPDPSISDRPAEAPQKIPKTVFLCEKVVRLRTLLTNLKYPKSLTDLLLREPTKLEDKIMPETGVAPKRSIDLEDLQRRISKQAEDVFGSSEIARRWLQDQSCNRRSASRRPSRF